MEMMIGEAKGFNSTDQTCPGNAEEVKLIKHFNPSIVANIVEVEAKVTDLVCIKVLTLGSAWRVH